MIEILLAILSVLNLILLIVALVKLFRSTDSGISEELRSNRLEINANVSDNIRNLGDGLQKSASAQGELLKNRLEAIKESEAQLKEALTESLSVNDRHTRQMLEMYAERLTKIEETLETRVKAMEESNAKKLEEMKSVVDEKLQTTLEERISRSFKEVSERLEQVYKGLGEMQSLATGVGDLKKVLSNVKTRGILGEIQLGAILEELLAPEQYEKDIATVEGSANRVEFAIKLPGSSEGAHVYLPVDAKFPSDAYVALCDSYEKGDADEIRSAKDVLVRRIKGFADDIHKKYISPPRTTDFGILFLPTEGLYAEAVRLGLVETLQASYKITLAGPTTMAALLNSLQMGFKTLAIQKRSSEVWDTLSAVKTEFEKFEDVLSGTQKKLNQVTDELEKLVGTRTRQINRRLRNVSLMSEDTVTNYLPLSDSDVGEQ